MLNHLEPSLQQLKEVTCLEAMIWMHLAWWVWEVFGSENCDYIRWYTNCLVHFQEYKQPWTQLGPWSRAGHPSRPLSWEQLWSFYQFLRRVDQFSTSSVFKLVQDVFIWVSIMPTSFKQTTLPFCANCMDYAWTGSPPKINGDPLLTTLPFWDPTSVSPKVIDPWDSSGSLSFPTTSLIQKSMFFLGGAGNAKLLGRGLYEGY